VGDRLCGPNPNRLLRGKYCRHLETLEANSEAEAHFDHSLASAFAHLGRDAEARDAAAHLFQLDPSFTVSAWIARGGQSNAELLTEGLRKAGLPE